MFDWLDTLAPPTNVTGPVLVAYVLFDIFLIVILARVLGNLLAKIGQPRVVGEILAGILLGPTLLGDTLSQVVAPIPARGALSAIATLALILFMFLAGTEFDAARIKGRVGQAGVLALLSVAVPALLGFPVAAFMYTEAFAAADIDFLPFALLLGSGLSVTAFPVMAHILMERGELNSPLGSLGVATAGMMSVLMFLYIAFAAAVAAGGFSSFVVNFGLILVFGVVSWFVLRPLLARTLPGMFQNGMLSGTGMAIVFGGMVLFGLITHLLDINALVGGFIWGLILPADPALRSHLAGKVRDIAMVLLLPVFFALAGFSTDLKLILPETLPIVALVLLAAIGGKFIAALPAKAFGLSWRDAAVLGALFNTRGLLVLVVGLIGLELNIITILTFTIFVVVALVTNLMTLPLLNYLSRPRPTP
jgi:Kef-type K+ transport system membrane component KefB